jgi:hypothetical protein
MKRGLLAAITALVVAIFLVTGCPEPLPVEEEICCWAKSYGGIAYDSAYSIQQTSDGGYIVAGITSSFGAGETDLWVLKLDSSGSVQWQKTYGGTKGDSAYSIQQTSDGGYIMAGGTSSFGAGETDLWVLKLDADGNIPDCPLIADSGAIIKNTNVAGVNTTAIVEDTLVTPADTNVTPSDTACSIETQCPSPPEN